MAIDDNVTSSSNNHLILINIKTNVVVDFNLDNFSSDKDSYLSNNYCFLSNNNYHKNNLNSGNNNKFDTSLIVSRKKRI